MDTLAPWMNKAILDLYAVNNRHEATHRATGPAMGTSIGSKRAGCVTRFPPEPPEYLHIGHAKAALLNDMLAHDQPNGTMICRFDDTNPSKESKEFQDTILEGLSALGVKPDRVTYSSDYFQEMYEACKGLIRSGRAYADDTDTDTETMKDQRSTGVPSKCRDMSIEETLVHFEESKAGMREFRYGQCCWDR